MHFTIQSVLLSGLSRHTLVQQSLFIIQFLLNMRLLSYIMSILGCGWYDQQRPSHFEYWWSSPSTYRPWSWCQRLDKTLIYQLVCCSFLIQINSDIVLYIWTNSRMTSHAIVLNSVFCNNVIFSTTVSRKESNITKVCNKFICWEFLHLTEHRHNSLQKIH